MKIFKNFAFILFFVNLLLVSSCVTNNKLTERSQMVENVIFEKLTRGSNEIVMIDQQKIQISNNGNLKEKTMNAKHWQNLVDKINRLEISKIHEFIAPTQERFHDGAKATTIYLQMVDGTTYNSSTYDESQPPHELKAINDYLELLVNQ